MSVSHDFFPGTYFWVIIQQKVLTKLEFGVNPLFPPLIACISCSDGKSVYVDSNSSVLCGKSLCAENQGTETYFRFSRKPGAAGDALCKLPVHHRWGLSGTIAEGGIFPVRTALLLELKKISQISWLKIALEHSQRWGNAASSKQRALKPGCAQRRRGGLWGGAGVPQPWGAAQGWSWNGHWGFLCWLSHPVKCHVGVMFVLSMVIVKPPVVGIFVRKSEWPKGSTLWLVLDQEIRVGLQLCHRFWQWPWAKHFVSPGLCFPSVNGNNNELFPLHSIYFICLGKEIFRPNTLFSIRMLNPNRGF